MKPIWGLHFCSVVVGALTLAGCSHQPYGYEKERAACVDNPPPTQEQILKMSTSELYRWWQMSRRASDGLATATVGRSKTADGLVDYPPCLVALAFKQGDFERELKYR